MMAVSVATAVPAEAEDGFVVDDRYVSDPAAHIPDPEFDEIDNHMIWQDEAFQLWLAKIDPVSGDLAPLDGRGKLLDSGLAPIAVTGNGPEFGYSDGRVFAMYTDVAAGLPALAKAEQQADRTWVATRLASPLNRSRPAGSQQPNDGPPRIVYNHTIDGESAVSWRNLDDATSERSAFGLAAKSGRWLPGGKALLVWKDVNGVSQTFRINVDAENPTPIQLTNEPEGTFQSFPWHAPEYDETLFVAIVGADGRQAKVFRETAPDVWTPIFSLQIPSSYEFISSPEGFAHNGKSYLAVVAASSLSASPFPFQPNGPSEVWVAGIDAAQPFYRRIDDSITARVRSEPEVFVTAQGPKVFYSERNEATGRLALRLADSGLGPEWGYAAPGYTGAWGTVYRDNRNSQATAYPIGEAYEAVDPPVALAVTQTSHPILGAEADLFLSLVASASGRAELHVYDTRSGARRLLLTSRQLSTGLANTNGLIAANGDFLYAADTQIARFSRTGKTVWRAAVRGLTRGLQVLPDGSVLVMTYNGWAQVFDAATGGLRSEQNLTPQRRYPTRPTCLSDGNTAKCAYIDVAAIDRSRARVFASYATPSGGGVVQAFDYNPANGRLTLAWASEALPGDIGSPALSADGARVYVQAGDDTVRAFDAATGTAVWSHASAGTAGGTPVVTDHGYLLPGVVRKPTGDGLVILEDTGAMARVAFANAEYAPLAPGAAGRGNRFVVMAERNSDGVAVLLVVHPRFGILHETPWTGEALNVKAVTLREDGWVFVTGSGPVAYRAFRPIFETAVR
jgi:outer membrane protein assembly factor BamB